MDLGRRPPGCDKSPAKLSLVELLSEEISGALSSGRLAWGEFARALADRGIPCKAPALLGMGLLLGPKGDPAFGSIFRPTFRYHTNDNEQSRYHCCDTGSGAKYWTLKLTPRGLPKKGLRTSSRMSL